ncbi:HoxN/HupN/NixA family nickel/cobalt transporter [Conexibacter sp. CPCC 206217]|uniref:HoxN/HupN/NixA family nickel/cobalt transporter n=1 Tax=Conexibacter sp. CPCC 206217 TaxID=3064574 RepID=UPI00271A2ADE|nr:HoxN/HupN/NixA family nickel/cobalt transporter [Conexibacter sp. CPCC 206217]MDO8210314.1 HoxN/HupN/NixA family nickel/cobalt transporter [Conexibacter sp. CPCC 206217]
MTIASIPAAARHRCERIRAGLTPQEWRRAAALAAVVLGLHVVGFFILLVLVVPHDYSLGAGGVFGLGVGITAYTLGLRHAFDADHIGAIDNTTRKLMSEGQRPLSVGFFFSLGHSTIVFLLGVLVFLGVRGLSGAVQDDDSALHQATGLVGPVVSGSFLFLIGILNLIILVSVVRIFRRMRHGEFDEAELERQLTSRGFMNRFYGRATRAVRKPWQMYPLGLLFGLGFDTATEVALLVLAGGAAAGGLPFYAIVCLPILFAAGMSLLDTIDGAFMNFAYGWAFSKPVRKVFYNITVTGLSVAVALLIGTVELLAVLAEKLGLTGGVWDLAAGLDLNLLGYVVVGLFVATWAIAIAVWRYGRIEERWSAGLRRP